MKMTTFLTPILLISSLVLFSQVSDATDSRQSTGSTSQGTSTQAEVHNESVQQPKRTTANPQKEVKATPEVKLKPTVPAAQEATGPKREIAASGKKINRLNALKIKKIYAKDGNLHVVLQYPGRAKLSPQDLIPAELIIRHGDKTDVFFLRNKMAQLRQLSVAGRAVDIDTGIKPKDGMVKVGIKGQRDTYTAKIAIKHTTPLEVPKKEMAVGRGEESSPKASRKKPLIPPGLPKKEATVVTTPLKVPIGEAVVEEPGLIGLHPKFWDVSLKKVVVYKQGWDGTYSYSEYGKKWGPSGTAPTSVIYDHERHVNYVIPLYVSPSTHSYIPMWFKVKPCISFKSVCMQNKITMEDIKKWSKPITINWQLSISGLPGTPSNILKSATIHTPPLSMQYYDAYQQNNGYLTVPGKGGTEICIEAEHQFYYYSLENIIPNRSTEVLYVEVRVDLDTSEALDEPDESNNSIINPTLTVIPNKPDNPYNSNYQPWQIKLLQPIAQSNHNKWFIGTTKAIQWEEGNIDGRLRIDLYRKINGFSDFVGTIAENIPSSSKNPGAFSENYNWYDWQAGHVTYGGGSKIAAPNDPSAPANSDFYWLKFFIKVDGAWQPLIIEEDHRFTLNNFTKQFGNQPKKEEMKSPDLKITQ